MFHSRKNWIDSASELNLPVIRTRSALVVYTMRTKVLEIRGFSTSMPLVFFYGQLLCPVIFSMRGRCVSINELKQYWSDVTAGAWLGGSPLAADKSVISSQQ